MMSGYLLKYISESESTTSSSIKINKEECYSVNVGAEQNIAGPDDNGAVNDCNKLRILLLKMTVTKLRISLRRKNRILQKMLLLMGWRKKQEIGKYFFILNI